MKFDKKVLGSFAFVALFLAIVLNLTGSSHNPVRVKSVKLGGAEVHVELAVTDKEQTLGLSGRQSLDADAGMLFVFDNPGKYYFWMKGMHFPIDMIWLSEDLHVIYIKKNATPENSLETFGPDEDAKYVLEVNTGFSEKNNLKVGDQVEFGY